jgi:hypothetical protein
MTRDPITITPDATLLIADVSGAERAEDRRAVLVCWHFGSPCASAVGAQSVTRREERVTHMPRAWCYSRIDRLVAGLLRVLTRQRDTARTALHATPRSRLPPRASISQIPPMVVVRWPY